MHVRCRFVTRFISLDSLLIPYTLGSLRAVTKSSFIHTLHKSLHQLLSSSQNYNPYLLLCLAFWNHHTIVRLHWQVLTTNSQVVRLPHIFYYQSHFVVVSNEHQTLMRLYHQQQDQKIRMTPHQNCKIAAYKLIQTLSSSHLFVYDGGGRVYRLGSLHSIECACILMSKQRRKWHLEVETCCIVGRKYSKKKELPSSPFIIIMRRASLRKAQRKLNDD